jgi:hypothetical protein
MLAALPDYNKNFPPDATNTPRRDHDPSPERAQMSL